ncbi:unnamed protein product [Linum trigynum]|uniref:Uncharacterized protein n=1 Tax=Linum trigynum TaxID=586398 RepID=A0AAV2FFP7_9ROSI
MGELLHGERSKSRIRRGIHTVKDGFLLLDVDRHFSKLKLAFNGDEDQARALGELLHGERSKSRIRRGIHIVKDGFLLLDVDRHFSKLKLAFNGDEDQARALGDSCSSLSLSRNRSISLKTRIPFCFG